MSLILTHGLTRYCLGNNESMDSIKKVGLLIIGWFFIALGILGLFLPFLQGILFILIGLAIQIRQLRRFRLRRSLPMPGLTRFERASKYQTMQPRWPSLKRAL